MESVIPFFFPLLGYLSGSLPFSIWVTRLLKGVDVRDAGSGHATTTNTIRQAGFGPGVLVFLADVAKGYLPTWLALHFAPSEWIIPLTAALAVVGHCWPVFAGFRGGMGLAPSFGGVLAISPLAALVALGLQITSLLIIRHGARSSIAVGLLLALVFWLFGLRGLIIWVGIFDGLILVVRFLVDWNRKYRELWLDREKPPKDGPAG